MEHKKWVFLCLIGGALMITSSVVGSAGFYGTIMNLISDSGLVGPKTIRVLEIVLMIFNYIAMGGGISVIVGALIAGYSSNFIGRLIAGIGIGAGLISLIIIIGTNIYGGSSLDDLLPIFLTTFNGSYGLAGVIISIFARRQLKD